MAVTVTFGGRRAQDPNAVARRCQDSGLPTDWVGLANRYVCPVGLAPGRGHLLLLRSDLDALDLTRYQRLTFAEDRLGSAATFPSLRVVGHPRCLNYPAPDPCHLVEVADRRIDLLGTTVERYEWRYHPNDANVSPNTDGHSSWESVNSILWPLLPDLGTWPGLPADVPSGLADVIDRLDLHAHQVRDAVEDALAAVGCGAVYDPFEAGAASATPTPSLFSVVYFPTAKDKADELTTASGLPLIYDERPFVPPDVGPVPGTVVVLFPAWYAGRSDRNPRKVYAVSVTRPSIPFGASLDTTSSAFVAYLQDYTPCRLWANGNVANTGRLADRAAQVTRIFYDRFAAASARSPIRRIVGGFAKDWKPGADWDVVAWGDTGRGPFTLGSRTGLAGTVELYQGAISTGLQDSLAPVRATRNGQPVRVGGQSPTLEPDSPRFVSVAGAGLGPYFERTSPLRQGDWFSLGTGGRADRRSLLWRNLENPPDPHDMERLIQVTEASPVSITVDGTAMNAYPAKLIRQKGARPDWDAEERCYLIEATGGSLVYARLYLAHGGDHADDGLRLWATHCCEGSSGSGIVPDGPGSDFVSTPCCPSARYPRTLFFSLTDDSLGDATLCHCLPETSGALSWVADLDLAISGVPGGPSGWWGKFLNCESRYVCVRLWCDPAIGLLPPGSPGIWQMTVATCQTELSHTCALGCTYALPYPTLNCRTRLIASCDTAIDLRFGALYGGDALVLTSAEPPGNPWCCTTGGPFGTLPGSHYSLAITH